jgi:hypothetical protein
MALSRNERRKAAKERFNRKVLNQTKAKVARARQAVKDTVHLNMSDHVERNFYPQSSSSVMAGQSHRGYVCRAGGSISKQGALALSTRVKTGAQGADRYARPSKADRHNWPIV